MSHIEYQTRAVQADRFREAEAARRANAVTPQRMRWTRGGPLRRARLRMRAA